MPLTPAQIKGIKDRVALGRKQGGNPDYGDQKNALYHSALDDLEALLDGYEPAADPIAEPEHEPASKAAHKPKKNG